MCSIGFRAPGCVYSSGSPQRTVQWDACDHLPGLEWHATSSRTSGDDSLHRCLLLCLIGALRGAECRLRLVEVSPNSTHRVRARSPGIRIPLSSGHCPTSLGYSGPPNLPGSHEEHVCGAGRHHAHPCVVLRELKCKASLLPLLN